MLEDCEFVGGVLHNELEVLMGDVEAVRNVLEDFLDALGCSLLESARKFES